MSTHNLYFDEKYEKYLNFLSENFHFFLVVKCLAYLFRLVFVMCLLSVGDSLHDMSKLIFWDM